MSYTGTTFQALIADELNRTDLTTKIATWCDMAVKELDRLGFWFQIEEKTIPTVPAQSYVALPTDFIKQIDKEIGEVLLNSSGVPLNPIGYPDINYLIHAATSQAEPFNFCITDKIKLHPIPDAIYNMTFSYYKSLGFPAAGATNAWTDDAWDLTFWAVMVKAWQYLGNTTEMTKAEVKKAAKLGELENNSGLRMATGNIRMMRF